MRINRFLHTLFETGEVYVNRVLEIDENEILQALPILKNHEESLLLNSPPGMPDFDDRDASKAIRIFYNICQFIVNRDFSIELIEEHLKLDEAFEDPRSLKTVRTVDSLFVYIVDIYKMARQLSEGDIICEKILQLAGLFPLSSVGIKVDEIKDAYVLENRALRHIYLNRIIKLSAADRLKNPNVLAALNAEMGLHLNLCRELMEKFSQEVRE